MKRHWKLILALALIFGGITWFVAQLFFVSTDIVVSKETTWLTEPLADDGLPDYAAYLLEQGREGVTPENNGAVPFLQAMWPAELELRHMQPLCEHLGMEVPEKPGMGSAYGDRDLREEVLAWLKKKYPEAAAREEELFGARGELGEELEGADPLATEPNVGEPAREEPAEEEPESGVLESDEGDAIDDPGNTVVADGAGGDVPLDEFGTEFEEPTLDERVERLLEELPRRPWRREECPPLAEWIDQRAAQYDLLHEAARRPRFYCPSPSLFTEPDDSLVNMMLPVVQTMRSAANALAMRAFLHLGEGDSASAWRDCEAVYRLGRHVPGETLVGQLVAIAHEEVANQVALAILDSPAITPEVARQMLDWFKHRPMRASMVDSIDEGERLMFITSMLIYSGQRQVDDEMYDSIVEADELSVAGKISINWNVVLKIGNEWYDRMVEAARIKDWHERRQAFDQMDADLDALRSKFISRLPAAIFSRDVRSRAVADVMLSLYLPALGAAFSAEDRANSYAQLHLVAAALAVHRLAEGEYPDSLDPLVPGLLDALPIDIYGQPLVYRRTDNGYLLHSLGPNGADEEGSHEMYRRYQGYQLDEYNEAALRGLLGMPPFDEEAAAVGVFEGEELSDPANFSLEGQIPSGADDWGVRLPLPNRSMTGE